MINFLKSRSNGKTVLLLFIAANGIYITMLAYSIPKVMAFSGGLPLFDMSPMGYSYSDAMALLDQLGEQGRHLYLTLQLVLDLFYPALFGLCYFCLTQWLIAAGKVNHQFWQTIARLPLFVCLFDYSENIGIGMMLTQYPSISESLVSVTSFFTLVKSLLTMTYFLGLIALLVLLAYKVITKKMAR